MLFKPAFFAFWRLDQKINTHNKTAFSDLKKQKKEKGFLAYFQSYFRISFLSGLCKKDLQLRGIYNIM